MTEFDPRVPALWADFERRLKALEASQQLSNSTVGDGDDDDALAVDEIVSDAAVSNDAISDMQDDIASAHDGVSQLDDVISASMAELDARFELAGVDLDVAREALEDSQQQISDAFDQQIDGLSGDVDTAITAAGGAASAASAAKTAADQAASAAATANSLATTAKSAADSANSAALAASGLAAAKGKVIVQVTAPSGSNADPANLWIDITADANGNPKNTPNRYNPSTSKWEPITDQKVLDAAAVAAAANTAAGQASAAAAAADTKAVNAQTTANTAVTNAATAQAAAVAAQSTADTAKTNAATAQTAANTANTAALTAAGIANGKGTVYAQVSAPAVVDPNGLWVDTDDGNKPYRGVDYGTAGSNLAVDPQARATANPANGTIGWGRSRWFGGGGGAGTQSNVSGATDGPVSGVTSYIRKAWTTASTSSGDTGFTLTGTNWAVTPGAALSIAAYLRASRAHGTSSLQIKWYKSDGTALTANGFDVAGPNVALPAATWARQTVSTTVPTGVAYAVVVADVDGAEVWSVGDTLDGTALLVRASATIGSYYDGSFLGSSWSGTPFASPSAYPGPAWVPVQDQAIVAAASAAGTAQTTADLAKTNAATAQAAADAAKTAAAAAQSTADTAKANAATAQTAADAANSQALSAAGIANGKGKVIYQVSAPTGANATTTNLWIRSSDNKPFTYDGTTWNAVTDKAATDAAAAAATAQQAATAAANAAAAAQATADGKPQILFSSTAGPSGTAPTGTIWFLWDSDKNVAGQWLQSGTLAAPVWTPQQIRSEVIANLDVAKLTVGSAAIADLVAQKIAAATGNFQTANVSNLFVTSGATMSQAVIDFLFANVVQAKKITAGMIDVGSLNGVTLTGTIVQTGTTGKRVVLGGNLLRFYDDNGLQSGRIEGFSNGAAGGILAISPDGDAQNGILVGTYALPQGGSANGFAPSLYVGQQYVNQVVDAGTGQAYVTLPGTKGTILANTNSNGEQTISHGLGRTPSWVIAQVYAPRTSAELTVRVSGRSTTGFTLAWYYNGAAWTGQASTTVGVHWMAVI
jgi:hypothetical protein